MFTGFPCFLSGVVLFCPMSFMRAAKFIQKKFVQTLSPILIEMLLIDLQT
jgi:hypothetical protein